MTTKLEGNLRREIAIGGAPYTVTLSPTGFTLVVKGRRKGLEIAWADLVSGDAALATALNKSLTANLAPPPRHDIAVKSATATATKSGRVRTGAAKKGAAKSAAKKGAAKKGAAKSAAKRAKNER
jgi:hypothetical protein